VKGRLFALTVGAITIAGVSFFFWENSEKPQTYQVMNPVICSLSEYVQCDGVVESSESFYVSPEKIGTVKRVYVDKGDKVSVNDILFTIETDGEVNIYRSPADGIIEMVVMEKGMPAIPQLTFIRIADFTDITVSVYVSEEELSQIQIGQSVKVTMDAYAGRVFSGEISAVELFAETQGNLLSKILNQNQKTVTASVVLKGDSDLFFPGLSVHAEVLTDVKEKTIMLPCSAVLQDENGYYVYEVNGENVIRVDVDRGEYRSGYYEIRKGVIAGKQYIINPDDALTEAGKVINELQYTDGVE